MVYCRNTFDKYIHHDPTDAKDQIAREERLKNTIIDYVKKYNSFINKDVWIKKQNNNTNNTNNTNNNKSKLINYFNPFKINSNTDTNGDKNTKTLTVYVKTIKNRDVYENGTFKYKKIIPETEENFIIKCSDNETVQQLVHYISDETGHNPIAIKIQEASDKLLSKLAKNNEVHLNVLLDHMTHNGYC